MYETKTLRVKRLQASLLAELQLQFAHIDGMLAVLVYGHLPAGEVGGILQLLEVGVGVAAKHKVDATGLLDNLLVGDGLLTLPPHVGDADNKVALLFVAQQLHHFLCCGYGVEIAHTHAVLG